MTRSEIIEKMIAARQSGDMADVLDVVESEWQAKVESARREGFEQGVRAHRPGAEVVKTPREFYAHVLDCEGELQGESVIRERDRQNQAVALRMAADVAVYAALAEQLRDMADRIELKGEDVKMEDVKMEKEKCPNCGPLGNDFCTWPGHTATDAIPDAPAHSACPSCERERVLRACMETLLVAQKCRCGCGRQRDDVLCAMVREAIAAADAIPAAPVSCGPGCRGDTP